MRVTIVNGDEDKGGGFDEYVGSVVDALRGEGHEVARLDLRDMDIRYCTGCFGCWVKTPGECVARDESETVCREALASDVLVFASPMVMGFPSALAKKAADKMIPILVPYIVIDRGEMHHAARYDRYPALGLLLASVEHGSDPDTDDEDIDITREMWSRTALNMKSRLAFTATSAQPIQEVKDAIASAA